jgi:pimeloyl-ACP methyl ester carboxylesterase
MRTVLSQDGTQIAYERTGTGPPLVFVHGGYTDRTAWRLVLPTLAQQFTVYAFDRRGCGQSGPYRADYATEREFEDVKAVVDMVGAPVHLVGHSFGALCALHGALLTPRVRRLVLYEPPLGGPEAIRPEVVDRIAALIAAGDPEGAALAFYHEIVGSRRQDREQFRAAPNHTAVVAGIQVVPANLRAFGRFRFEAERLRTLETPTLLLVGSETPAFLKGTTATVAAALPAARIVQLPGQGHGAHTSAPHLLATEILRFLTAPANAPGRSPSSFAVG